MPRPGGDDDENEGEGKKKGGDDEDKATEAPAMEFSLKRRRSVRAD